MTSDAAPTRTPGNRLLRILWLTLVKYSSIDGQQLAASFAYYAFFALFPFLLLMVSIGSYFFNPGTVSTRIQETVSQVVLVEHSKHDMVGKTIRGVIKSRRGAGSFAVLGLIWSALRFFQSLVRGVNRAWGTHEYTWWRLPLQNMMMVGILAVALLVGMVGPAILSWLVKMVWHLQIPFGRDLIILGLGLVQYVLPSAILFLSFSAFYKLAPRRRTSFREVWFGALMVTLLLRVLQFLFVLYARNIAHFNAVYGAFGSVIAVLMWVYLTGSVIILGGCFCAAQAEEGGRLQYPAAEEASRS